MMLPVSLVFNIFNNLLENINNWFTDRAIEQINEIFKMASEGMGLESLKEGPAKFLPKLFEYIENIHDTIVIPVAAIGLVYIFCLKLNDLLNEKNNHAHVELWHLAKLIIEVGLALMFMTHAFKISVAVLEIGTHLVTKILALEPLGSVSVTTPSGNFGDSSFGVFAISFLGKYLLKAVRLVMGSLVYAHFLQLYLYLSVAAIPLSTFLKPDLSSIGQNYLKNLIAWALTAFFMILTISMLPVVLQAIIDRFKDSSQIDMIVTVLVAYGLSFSIFMKSNSIAKSILNAG